MDQFLSFEISPLLVKSARRAQMARLEDAQVVTTKRTLWASEGRQSRLRTERTLCSAIGQDPLEPAPCALWTPHIAPPGPRTLFLDPHSADLQVQFLLFGVSHKWDLITTWQENKSCSCGDFSFRTHD